MYYRFDRNRIFLAFSGALLLPFYVKGNPFKFKKKVWEPTKPTCQKAVCQKQNDSTHLPQEQWGSHRALQSERRGPGRP